MVTKREAPVFAAAGGKYPLVLATLRKGARVKVNRIAGEYIRVQLQEDSYGWLRAEDVRFTSSPRLSKQEAPPLSPCPPRTNYRVCRLPGGRVVTGNSTQLSGTVVGRKLRDMYVLVNDEKVFFRQGPKLPEVKTQDELSMPNEEAARLPFNLNLKLKDGLNKVLVVARLDERVMSYKSLYISKRVDPQEAGCECRADVSGINLQF